MQQALSEEDEVALGKLYLPCHEDLMLYCLGKFKNPELAQDAASETLRMLLEHPDPASIPNLKAWLLSVAKHACLKVITREERRAHLLQRVPTGLALALPRPRSRTSSISASYAKW